MARPKKDTIDYFPHDSGAYHGDTMTILQSKFGNDGYAFWFKMLEKLCESEGHIIDCRNPTKWELLQSITRVNEVMACRILDLLAELGNIDTELWGIKVIWCQNLVDNISDVYKNRRANIPQKPSIYTLKQTSDGVSTGDNPSTPPISTEALPPPQTVRKAFNIVPPPKVKTKLDKISVLSPVEITDDKNVGEVFSLYEAEIGMLTPTISEGIKDWLNEHPVDKVKEAIKEAALHGARTAQYINRILENWKMDNYKPRKRASTGKRNGESSEEELDADEKRLGIKHG